MQMNLVSQITQLDMTIHRHTHHLLFGYAKNIVWLAANFGARFFVGAILLVTTVIAARREQSWKPIAVGVTALVALAVVVGGLKIATNRPAPSADGGQTSGLSFPSGHTANAVVMWGLIANYANVRRRRTWLIATGAGLIVGVSVLALDYHWLSDVIAGEILGLIILGGLFLMERQLAEPIPLTNSVNTKHEEGEIF